MNRVKTSVLVCAALVSFCADARSGSWDVGIGSGVGMLAVPDSNGDELNIHIPATLSVGYGFGRFRFSLEGFFAFPSFSLFESIFGSVVSSYSFTQSTWIEGYALLGLGVGYSIFMNDRNYSDSSRVNSGPLQIQAGVGVRFQALEWLDLATETRLRVGVPDNPDVLAITQHIWVVFTL